MIETQTKVFSFRKLLYFIQDIHLAGEPMAKTFEDSLKRFYNLYASDLSLSEIERLIKRDAPGVYDFYLREADQPDKKQDPFERTFRTIGNLFTAFIRKLTPARRALYSLILFFFAYAVIASSWIWASISFLFLNVLLAFELADKLTAKDELEVAREIQMGLMPAEAPANLGYDIACFSEAARDVGGDYYDFIQPQALPGTTFIVIGDVSGKGMGAALRMVQVQAILHNLSEQYAHPKEILQALDQNLRNILKVGSFFTVSMASFNSDNSLHLCRAGHMPLIHYQKAQHHCREIVPPGIGVGLPECGKFNQELEEVDVKIAPGDVLVFYTDGVVETMNNVKSEFGEERLKRVVVENAEKPAAEIQDAILKSVAQFRGAAPFHDDLTMIVMKA